MVFLAMASSVRGCFGGCSAFLVRPNAKLDRPMSEQSTWASSEDVDRHNSFGSWHRSALSKRIGDSEALCMSEASTTMSSDAHHVEMLYACFGEFSDGSPSAACEYLTHDCVVRTLYEEEIHGRNEIEHWSLSERRRGVRNASETPWEEVRPGVFKRELKVIFPSKSTHGVVQSAMFEDDLINGIVVEPKFPALRVALRFARARASDNDDLAIEQMADHIVWHAWDGLVVRGRDAVRKFFRQQRAREVRRFGETEFEAARINDQGGCFERKLYIERVDGIKVRATQQVYVRSELAELDTIAVNGTIRKLYGTVPRIVEVKVLLTKEWVGGKWETA